MIVGPNPISMSDHMIRSWLRSMEGFAYKCMNKRSPSSSTEIAKIDFSIAFGVYELKNPPDRMPKRQAARQRVSAITRFAAPDSPMRADFVRPAFDLAPFFGIGHKLISHLAYLRKRLVRALWPCEDGQSGPKLPHQCTIGV